MELQAIYKSKLRSIPEAVETVKSGDTIVHSMCVSEPAGLLHELANQVENGRIEDIYIYTLLALQHSKESYLRPGVVEKINPRSWFVSGFDRELVKNGDSIFVPNEFYQIPRLIKENMDLDVVFATVSPMDSAGYFSFGTSNDYTTSAARRAKILIVEVNPRMPRVFGDSMIHVSKVDHIVENEVPLQKFMPHKVGHDAEELGKKIIEMIPDRATIQLGIGSIPSAVARHLKDHKDLGLHTEVFVPEMVDLIEADVLTGKYKKLHPRKHTFTIAQGDRRLYDFIHDNPAVESYPVDVMNYPHNVATQPDMISINSTIQVDLWGQCNSEFLNGSQYSAIGGQLDFVRGAYNSKDGKSIIAFTSTAAKGKVSKVVPQLPKGTIVTVPRGDTHWLATEYGMVNLKGKDTKERALAIISIAHPDFRDDLIKAAKEMGVIR